MISAYLEASWTLERDDLREAALQALAFLRSRCQDGASGSMYRYHDGTPYVPGLIADQSQTARALLDAYEVTGDPQYFENAVELARLLETHFVDRETGGFWDVWDETEEVGRLKDRQKSVQENAVCAELFLRLGHMTRETRYLDVARATIEAFVGVYPQMGYFAAGYAKQADIFLNPPVEVNIVGSLDAAGPLHRAALSLESPARTVQVLNPERDADRLASLFLPTEPSPAAYVCFGTMCSAPVTDPDQLTGTVRQLIEARPREITPGD
jgi:uncharacterized protein YyaL (SSP411 family)